MKSNRLARIARRERRELTLAVGIYFFLWSGVSSKPRLLSCPRSWGRRICLMSCWCCWSCQLTITQRMRAGWGDGGMGLERRAFWPNGAIVGQFYGSSAAGNWLPVCMNEWMEPSWKLKLNRISAGRRRRRRLIRTQSHKDKKGFAKWLDCLRVLVCLCAYVWVLSACKSIGSHIIISSGHKTS